LLGDDDVIPEGIDSDSLPDPVSDSERLTTRLRSLVHDVRNAAREGMRDVSGRGARYGESIGGSFARDIGGDFLGRGAGRVLGGILGALSGVGNHVLFGRRESVDDHDAQKESKEHEDSHSYATASQALLASAQMDTQSEILSVLKAWHDEWVAQRNIDNRVEPLSAEEGSGSGEGGDGGGSLFDFMGSGRGGRRGARGGRLGKLMKGKFGRGLSTAGKVAGIAGLAAGAYMLFSDGAAAKEQWTDSETGDVNNSNVAGSVIAGERSGNTGKNALNAGLKFSALGAGVGSFIPGVGTAIGAGVGALVGGAIGLIGQENVAGFVGDVFGRSTNDIKQEIGYWGDLADNPEKAKELGYDPDVVRGKIEKYRGDMLDLLKKGGSTGVLGGVLTKMSTEMARGTAELEKLLKEADETIYGRVGKTRGELEGILEQHKIDSFKEFGGADKVMGMTEKSLKSGDFDKTLKNLQAINFMVAHPEKFSEEQFTKAQSLHAKATEEHRKNAEKRLKDELEFMEDAAVFENRDNFERIGPLGSIGIGSWKKDQVNAVKQEARYKYLSKFQGKDEEDIVNAGFGGKAEYERMLSASEFDSQRFRASASLDSDLKSLSVDYSKSYAERQEQEKLLKARAAGVKNRGGGLVSNHSELVDVMAMFEANPQEGADFLQTLNQTAADYFKLLLSPANARNLQQELNREVARNFAGTGFERSRGLGDWGNPFALYKQLPSATPV